MEFRSRVWSAAFATIAAASGCPSSPYPEVKVDMSPPPPASPEPTAPVRPVLRFSVAAIQSPRDTYAAYSRFFERMGTLLGVEIQFVQRRSYAEVNELLVTGKIDAALVCTGGYLDLVRRAPGAVEVLAVPVIGGQTTYRSLLIVPASSKAASLRDLGGKRFAFTDELSFSGHMYPAQLLANMGAPRFFGSTLFTRSHDRSIEAVVQGVVDGAAVDSLVYEALALRDTRVAGGTRVIHRSPPFGLMPVVASTRMSREARDRLRAVLLDLHRDPPSSSALGIVGIERFVTPAPGMYDAAAAVAERVR